jgi:hypothetical protein
MKNCGTEVNAFKGCPWALDYLLIGMAITARQPSEKRFGELVAAC